MLAVFENAWCYHNLINIGNVHPNQLNNTRRDNIGDPKKPKHDDLDRPGHIARAEQVNHTAATGHMLEVQSGTASVSEKDIQRIFYRPCRARVALRFSASGSDEAFAKIPTTQFQQAGYKEDQSSHQSILHGRFRIVAFVLAIKEQSVPDLFK
ncbi:hypothetical protein Pdw03_4457 [Penicillium digitatum]|uniref:Uncharacterized protein n=1 Tax=Penicillium digitatum TaxID=36651 RepID=A0A7T6XI59_PENDI|nr:hypothetical protein PDIDSM_6421 [Penicillium digitatum]QQK41603.1 hypothetical protein Pdw03_4457 [Penicillium digitatum]